MRTDRCGFPCTIPPQTPARSPGDLARAVGPGERVTVTLRDGTRLNGRVASVASHQLMLRSGDGLRAVPAGDLDEVRKRGDRLWNGALIGVGIGALGGGVIGGRACTGRNEDGFCAGVGALIGMPLGALAGLAVDAAMPHRTVLYARPDRAALPPG